MSLSICSIFFGNSAAWIVVMLVGVLISLGLVLHFIFIFSFHHKSKIALEINFSGSNMFSCSGVTG